MKAIRKTVCFIAIFAVLLAVINTSVFAEGEVSINAIPDKYQGDSVTISGNTIFEAVSIKVLYPSGDQYNVETVQSSGGTYSYTFKLSSDLPYGTYTVVAGRGDNVDIMEFEVIPVPQGPPEEPEEPDESDGDKGKKDTSPADTENINKIIEKIKELEGSPDIKGKALKDAQDKHFKELESAVYENLVHKIKADIKDSKANSKAKSR